ncbi:hypothetical protein V8F20_005604 [Naviculisporaceae sp. PSN 640]
MKLKHSLSLLLLSPGISLAREDANYDPDPARSLRPRNVTDLAYWLYGWTGSYYNGTTTFHFTPLHSRDPLEEDQAEEEEGRWPSHDPMPQPEGPTPSCSASNHGFPEPTSSRPRSPAYSPSHLPSDQIMSLSWYFESVSPPEKRLESSTKPRWNLTLDKPQKPDGINTLFSFSAQPIYYPPGYTPLSIKGLQLNMSTCDNPWEPTWWGVSFLTVNDTLEARNRFTPVDPTFRVAFDNQSASFQYSGNYLMNTDPGNDFLDNGDPKRNTLLGTVRVEFLGSIDPVRSDVLVESDENKPAWVPVIGFGNGTGTIDAASGGSDSGAGGLRSHSLALLAVLTTGAVSIGWYL